MIQYRLGDRVTVKSRGEKGVVTDINQLRTPTSYDITLDSGIIMFYADGLDLELELGLPSGSMNNPTHQQIRHAKYKLGDLVTYHGESGEVSHYHYHAQKGWIYDVSIPGGYCSNIPEGELGGESSSSTKSNSFIGEWLTELEQRKKDGLCPVCGEKGRFHLSEMICSTHGVYR